MTRIESNSPGFGRLQPLSNKRVLLLQGPMGPFFAKLERCLRARGATTFRICFNGGDRFFARRDSRVDYRATTAQWRSFISNFYAEKKIEAIVLYGDCRFYHLVAEDVAKQSGIPVFVFEEGYVRPNFVTFEENGVNAQSALPRDADFYRQLKLTPAALHTSLPDKYDFHRWALFTIVYFVFMRLWRHRYPHNQHHRNTHIGFEIVYGIRNLIRKMWFALHEKPLAKAIGQGLSKKYYFVPLQVQYDCQISKHSRFNNMEDFIRLVTTSFADHAPAYTCLIFKHHPMDRGRPLFYGMIRRLARQLGISHRVHVVHDTHLPTCLKNAIGTITINSTVGIASLFHGTPTIVLGEALYDIEGLTCKGLPLDHFWSKHPAPDRRLFRKFRSHLIKKTQLHGSFYRGFPGSIES
jgi:capsular polysaccharide export protein